MLLEESLGDEEAVALPQQGLPNRTRQQGLPPPARPVPRFRLPVPLLRDGLLEVQGLRRRRLLRGPVVLSLPVKRLPVPLSLAAVVGTGAGP